MAREYAAFCRGVGGVPCTLGPHQKPSVWRKVQTSERMSPSTERRDGRLVSPFTHR
jgi:hypothetical protein